MLDYKYELTQYHTWIKRVCRYAHKEYDAEIELLGEDNSFIYYHNIIIFIRDWHFIA